MEGVGYPTREQCKKALELAVIKELNHPENFFRYRFTTIPDYDDIYYSIEIQHTEQGLKGTANVSVRLETAHNSTTRKLYASVECDEYNTSAKAKEALLKALKLQMKAGEVMIGRVGFSVYHYQNCTD